MNEQHFEPDEYDLKLLVDTLRKCFDAQKARYHLSDNTLIIQIVGLEKLTEPEITEVAEPVLEELDMGFDEILLLPLN